MSKWLSSRSRGGSVRLHREFNDARRRDRETQAVDHLTETIREEPAVGEARRVDPQGIDAEPPAQMVDQRRDEPHVVHAAHQRRQPGGVGPAPSVSVVGPFHAERAPESIRQAGTMATLGIIGVPSSAGCRRTGQDRAPAAFRQAGLLERPRAAGLRVEDRGDLDEVRYNPTQSTRASRTSRVSAGSPARWRTRSSAPSMRACARWCWAAIALSPWASSPAW